MPFDETKVIVPIGKTLAYCATSNGTFTTIFGTTDITPPEGEIGKSEYTNDSSPYASGSSGVKVKQYKSNLLDPGTCSAKYKYQPAQFATLEGLRYAGADLYWKLTLPDGSIRAFKGFITKHSEDELGLEEVPDINLEVQVNGGVAYTPPS